MSEARARGAPPRTRRGAASAGLDGPFSIGHRAVLRWSTAHFPIGDVAGCGPGGIEAPGIGAGGSPGGGGGLVAGAIVTVGAGGAPPSGGGAVPGAICPGRLHAGTPVAPDDGGLAPQASRFDAAAKRDADTRSVDRSTGRSDLDGRVPPLTSGDGDDFFFTSRKPLLSSIDERARATPSEERVDRRASYSGKVGAGRLVVRAAGSYALGP